METKQVIQDLAAFRDERNWNEFHTLINLARALSIEASEVEKVFQWKNTDNDLSEEDRAALKLEIADVLTYAYYMCDRLGADPDELVEQKLAINKKRHWKFEG